VNNAFDSAKKYIFYLSLLASLFALCAYITIINQSYFFQDDFYFWPRYSTIDFHALLDPRSNFGRPVTRDLYFYLTSHIFGSDSSSFFYLNLAVIAGVCWFIYRLLREFSIDPYIAAAAAAIYFYMAPTVPHASWISNSQHTVAHLFSFWFIVIVISGINDGRVRLARAAFVYLLALFSNVSSLFAVAFVGVYVLLRNHKSPIPQIRRLMLVISALALVTVAWSLTISHSAAAPYKLDLSLQHALVGAQFYDNLLRAGMLGRGYWPIFIAAIVLVALNVRRTYVLTLPLLAAFGTAFGMLFFLSGQRTLGYMAIPYILFALMLFVNFATPAFRSREIRSVVLVGLSAIFVFYSLESGAPQRDDFTRSPFGSGIRQVQAAVRNVPVAGNTTFCFAPATGPGRSGSSEFWLFLGSGHAFWLVDYGDNYQRKFVYYTDPECAGGGVVRVSVSQRGATLGVADVTLPK
jgi:hypothetical protein